MTSNPLTDKQIALAVELAKARVEYVRKHGAPLLNNEEEVTLIALRELQDKRKLLKAAERRIAELEAQNKPAKGEVLVTVSGFTGCGKSAIAGEIEIAMKAIGVPVRWTNSDVEKRMTSADWLTVIEMYRPNVRIVEVNVPRAAGIGVTGE
ncbi:ead/Ea22-like family protein [Salmonella enterica]